MADSFWHSTENEDLDKLMIKDKCRNVAKKHYDMINSTIPLVISFLVTSNSQKNYKSLKLMNTNLFDLPLVRKRGTCNRILAKLCNTMTSFDFHTSSFPFLSNNITLRTALAV